MRQCRVTGGTVDRRDRRPLVAGGLCAPAESLVAGSRDFAASGSKLVSLTFPKTTTQAMGDVVVYSNYELVSAASSGEQTTQWGRAAEVFRWKDGRWLHPEWHLDSGQ